jgi:uncharacterized sulfatase
MKNLLAALLLAPLAALYAAEPVKPNIVIFIADDLSWYDVACFGGPTSAKTPNVDRLAGEGMKLMNFYSPAAVCAPVRQALLTGLYPVRNGAYPNHSHIKPGTKSLPHHLKPLGYRTACIGKTHFGPPESFPFDLLEIARNDKTAKKEKGGGDEADDGEINLNAFEKFTTKDEQPFCAYLATHEPHGPFTKGDPFAHDPKSFVLPPYLPDTEVTRKQLQGYYAEINVLDQQVGEVMKILQRTGKAANTLLLFVSEQGNGFPFSKWTLYNPGIRVAAIARWPGHIKPGSTSVALVQYVDVLPTILAAAGADPDAIDTGCPDATGNKGFDGRSFLDVLLGQREKLRDYVFAENTMLGVIGIESPYASRMVGDGRWKLIVNFHASAPFPHAGFGLGKNWKMEGERGNAFAATQLARFTKRPANELYDLQNDPWELKNVADKPENKETITRLRAQLDAWMKQQGDEGAKTEQEAYEHQGNRGQRKTASGKESPLKTDVAAKKSVSDRADIFEKKDKNHDGKLSREEFLATQSDPETAKARFEKWDTDKDGSLSRDEFINSGGKSK